MLPATPLPKSVGQAEVAEAQLIVGMKTGDADFGNFLPATYAVPNELEAEVKTCPQRQRGARGVAVWRVA